jgi:hypothetical protein
MAVEKCNSQLDIGLYLFTLSYCMYFHLSKANDEKRIACSTDCSERSLEIVFRDHLENQF